MVFKRSVPGFSYLQKGIRERLLCDACEQRFGDLERRFKQAWFDRPALPDPLPRGFVLVDGLDYPRTKLFFLSILWRSSVATHKAFDRVALGPHEERVRSMLLGGDPGRPDQYAIYGAVLFHPATRSPMYDLIVPPFASRHAGHRLYVFTFAGCAWQLLVSRHSSLATDQISLSIDGTARLVPISASDFSPALNLLSTRRGSLSGR